jgi:hypothetical protein
MLRGIGRAAATITAIVVVGQSGRIGNRDRRRPFTTPALNAGRVVMLAYLVKIAAAIYVCCFANSVHNYSPKAFLPCIAAEI